MRTLIALLIVLAALPIQADRRGILLSKKPVAAGGSSLLTDLVASWPLDEASGSALDESAAGLDLADNNTVGADTGKIYANARYYNGGAEFHSRASEAALQMGDIDFTITAWVYVIGAGAYVVVGKDDEAASSRDYTLDIFGDKFRFYVNGSSIAEWGSTLSLNTWYFVACGHDAAADQTWIKVNNAAAVTAATSGAVPHTSSAQFRIGAREYNGAEGHFDGRIQQVRMWKRKLTADEMTTLYNGGSGTTTPF